ncbi:MAG TPA: hypothetical protein DIU44_02465 [Acholeplasmatales bacterium]|nr:hypothetical protein [Acholeplasmatales bacterium]
MIVLNIIAFIFAIGIIILIHEAGHFYCAKKAGILCHEFSIGMGPVLWQKRKGETMISIRAIPIGGYVAMADSTVEQILINEGETIGINLEDGSVKELVLDQNLDADFRGVVKHIELLGVHGEGLEVTLEIDGEDKTYPILRDAFLVSSPKDRMQITPYDRSFDSKKISQRFITISAGVIMNFVLSIVLYLIISFVTGVPANTNIVGSVGEAYPSAKFLSSGDIIKEVNGKEVTDWNSLGVIMEDVAMEGKTTITLKYIHDGVLKEENNCGVYLVLNSFGLSNMQIDENASSYDKGAQVGNLGLKYGTGKDKATPSDDETVLKNGDYITAIRIHGNSEWTVINDWSDLISNLNAYTDVISIDYKFYSQDKKKEIDSQTPIYSYSDALLSGQDIIKLKAYIGISPEYHFDFWGCTKAGFKQFGESSLVIFSTLKELIAPSANIREVGLSDLSGVVGIFNLVSRTLSSGFLAYLSLIALLSVNIGIMNFLPIPALDGGRAVFLIYEAITHKKPNKKFETLLNDIVFILLLILFVFVTYNDILRLFKK